MTITEPRLIYVSGRIKDYEDHPKHFARGCGFIRALGHEPLSPLDVIPDEDTYEGYMRADIRALLECDAIYMLRGWEQSAGARCEHLVAAMCGIEIMYEKEPL